MKKENTSLRLQKVMELRDLKQIDILNLVRPYCEKFGVKMNKSHLSQYISGKSEPGQDKLAVLGMALDVNEAWLMGYDVPMERAEILIEICNPDNDAFLQRMKSYYWKYFSKYDKCSEAGKKKINKYIDNVYEMEQAEKEVSNKKADDDHLSSIPGGKASASNDNDYLTPVAAHNDDTSEEQIKLMREDLDEL